jgi:ribosome-associated translation inhibitor RaiA
MQVLLHSDPNTDGSPGMTEHLKRVVQDALGRFGERVTRVEAHLSDANSSAKPGGNDIQCTLEARLVGLDAVVVKDRASNAHQAIDGAARKIQRAVTSEIGKHPSHGQRGQADVSKATDDTPD